jgi:hypothetical protein
MRKAAAFFIAVDPTLRRWYMLRLRKKRDLKRGGKMTDSQKAIVRIIVTSYKGVTDICFTVEGFNFCGGFSSFGEAKGSIEWTLDQSVNDHGRKLIEAVTKLPNVRGGYLYPNKLVVWFDPHMDRLASWSVRREEINKLKERVKKVISEVWGENVGFKDWR